MVLLRSLLLSMVIVLLAHIDTISATDVRWVGNDDDDNAPLPLSSRQRQQLLQLEQAIQSAPDPEKTLRQVAEANQMSPQELVSMINKNSQDLAQNPSLAQPSTLPKMIFKFMSVAAVSINQAARKNPKMFAATVACTILVMYTAIGIPRTGVVISSGRGVISKGPTTLFAPPTTYLSKLANADRVLSGKRSTKTQKIAWDDLHLEDDGVEIHDVRSNAELSQATTAQFSMDAESLLDELNLDLDDDAMSELSDEVVDMLFDNVVATLSSRQLTEFVPDSFLPIGLRYVSSSDKQKKNGVLSVRGLGDWGLHGMVFLDASKETSSDSEYGLTLSTLKGGNPFDGQLHISCHRSDDSITVRTHIVVPRNGKKLPRNVAKLIVGGITQSVLASTEKRSQQILARRSQSSRYRGMGQNKAAERRHSRFVKEKEIEEMAADRRRRWQRRNPDAGRYRPSGVRQQSPNNC